MKKWIFILFSFFCFSISCTWEWPNKLYKTENVIVLVIDGARYSETWGEKTHQYIPCISECLSKKGVIFTEFYNNGETKTVPGHTAIATGFYQEINNSGTEIPMYPSLFQYFNKKNEFDSISTWIITSKDKLAVLSDCNEEEFHGKYNPLTNCGVNGLGTGYRHDSITFNVLLSILLKQYPRIVLVNFREPDFSGHLGVWDNYIEGIKFTDKYVCELWEFLQSNPNYSGKTSLFVTNDHGRHLDSITNGFIGHGDGCQGCRHVTLFAIGPDFKEDVTFYNKREQVDITATIAEILGLKMPYCQGKVMHELFK